MYSIAIYLPMALLDVGGLNILEGWTPLVWGIACLHASGGVLVALSVLYSSSVTKTVAVCASLVLTTVMGNRLFDAPLNGAIGLGCAVVVISVFGYRDDCEVEEELRRPMVAQSRSCRITPTLVLRSTTKIDDDCDGDGDVGMLCRNADVEY